MFCQMGKGKRAQLYNVLGVWWSASRLWRALPPSPPKSLLSGLESGTLALAACFDSFSLAFRVSELVSGGCPGGGSPAGFLCLPVWGLFCCFVVGVFF